MTPAEKVELALRRQWGEQGYPERILEAVRVVMDNADAINAIFAPHQTHAKDER